MKKCNVCQIDKNLDDFYKSKTGYQAACKHCKSIYDKKRRSEKSEELKEKSKIYRDSLTKEQKDKTNKSKKFINITCSLCEITVNKRQDTLKNWSGLCVSCSRKEVANRPEIKEQLVKNGLAFIEKFGKIPSAKLENRPRGKKHWAYGLSRVGENSPNWKGGVTLENERIRHSKEYKKWRLLVFERDNFTCINCGDNKGGNLNADHIQPFSLYPELRLDLDNGRTLCEHCHKKIGWSPSKAQLNGTTWVSH